MLASRSARAARASRVSRSVIEEQTRSGVATRRSLGRRGTFGNHFLRGLVPPLDGALDLRAASQEDAARRAPAGTVRPKAPPRAAVPFRLVIENSTS